MWSKLTYLFGGPFDASLGLFLIIGGFVFCLAAIALPFFGLWSLFGKCGIERWRGLVPFYNVWMLTRLTCGKSLLFWVQLALQALCFLTALVFEFGALKLPLTVLFFVAQALVGVLIGLAVSRSFGSGPGFGVGIGLLPSVFLFILGLDKTEYLGPEITTYFAESAENDETEASPDSDDDSKTPQKSEEQHVDNDAETQDAEK
ncbi:MAG TPA: hypothetical protein IAD17_03835 [Candidatus Coprovicinus avistercoris]|uniref:Uncharacterized protein n=1 Tax=Candidatus Coprovicinus avistercoris TaxID=2840754 RepID=A0A9D1HWI2_9ACTN|nr:hypothetical protein [Candidatus Coprovicinus avistercoris]